MKTTVIFLLSLVSAPILALDIDSTFLARFLGFSNSKRTALINQGTEIGLKTGDHAKISLPGGMVARAMLVKLAPNRSVWSIYRFVDKGKLVLQGVATFKISSAVKLTTDESKHLGVFAETIKKQNEKLESEQLKQYQKTLLGAKELRLQQNQERLGQQLARAEVRGRLPVSQEFASLEDEVLPPSPDRDIDWSGLDGQKDDHYFDGQLDYSLLK